MLQWLLVLHVLGATIWTGGHLLLALQWLPEALRTKQLEGLQAFEARFEKIGIPALLVQVSTGLWLAWNFVPSFSRWLSFSDPMGRTVGLKLLLLLTTVVLAADARLRVLPRLTPANLHTLAWHIVPVTVVSVLFVVVGIGLRFGGF